MNDKDKELVVFKVEDEGFDYTFRDYSDFKQIKDKQFHKLRLAYIEAANELALYLDIE